MTGRALFTASSLGLLVALAVGLGLSAAGAGSQSRNQGRSHQHRRGADALDRHVTLTPEQQVFVEVTTAPAELRALGSRIEATGLLAACPDRVAKVGPVISGRVSEVLVNLGDRVEAGQPLAKLVSVEIGEAMSEYYKALAELELAAINYERYERLISRDIGARKDLLAAEADHKIAQANCNAAEKTLHAFGFTEEDLDEIEDTHTINAELLLRCPIAGRVVERNATVGERVGEDSTLFTVMDLSTLFVEAQVFERDVARLCEGQRTEVTVNARPGTIIEGEVIHISQQIDPDTRTLAVRTAVDNPGEELKVGMFVTVRIFTGRETPVICVPASALVEDGGGHGYVFVPHGDGYQLTAVEIGYQDEEQVEITAGLSAGQPVVVEGSYGLYATLKQASGTAGRTHSP
jgi:cobalt-zinc-cadmium efflux system membrane fusion protein